MDGQIKVMIETMLGDRFYRTEFESFLENNPELTPPANWEAKNDG